jgi:hypothetical protein
MAMKRAVIAHVAKAEKDIQLVFSRCDVPIDYTPTE